MRNPFDTDERRAFRDSVARFVKQEIEPHADAWDEAGTFPWEVHEKACALGLFGFGIDEAYGGNGFDDAFMRCACCHTRVDVSTGCNQQVHHLQCMQTRAAGSRQQAEHRDVSRWPCLL